MIVIGIVLIAIGLPLATTPQQAMRGASMLRSIGLPPDPSPTQVRTWRAVGAAVAVAGAVLLVLAFV